MISRSRDVENRRLNLTQHYLATPLEFRLDLEFLGYRVALFA